MRHLVVVLLLPTVSVGQGALTREPSGAVPLLAIAGVLFGGLFIVDAFFGLRTARAFARTPARMWRGAFACVRRRAARVRRARERESASDALSDEIQEWFAREEAKG